jgi:hypothetical protein
VASGAVGPKLRDQLLGCQSDWLESWVFWVCVRARDLGAGEQRHHLAVLAAEVTVTLPAHPLGQLRDGEGLRPQRCRIQPAWGHAPVLPVDRAEPRSRHVRPVQVGVRGTPLPPRSPEAGEGRPDDFVYVTLSDRDGVRCGDPWWCGRSPGRPGRRSASPTTRRAAQLMHMNDETRPTPDPERLRCCGARSWCAGARVGEGALSGRWWGCLSESAGTPWPRS